MDFRHIDWGNVLVSSMILLFIGFTLFLVIGLPVAYFHDKKECELHGRWYKIEALYSNKLKTKHTTRTGVGFASGGGTAVVSVPSTETVNEYVYELNTGDLFVAEDPYRVGSEVRLYQKNDQGLFYQRGFTEVRHYDR